MLVLLAVAAVTAAGCASPARSGPPFAAEAPPSRYAALQESFSSAIAEVLPSVVEIRTNSGLGSGVVFDGRGNSAALVPGDIVLAIGNPLGLDSSVIEGIVSAVGRIVSEPASDGSPGATLLDTIQTSAAINPGNSGGALATLDGKVVGIPTLAAVGQVGGSAPGIGFAIPAGIALDIARQLAATGHVTDSHRAALGVSVAVTHGSGGSADIRVPLGELPGS
jgi:S1-C subfamily serine protease